MEKFINVFVGDKCYTVGKLTIARLVEVGKRNPDLVAVLSVLICGDESLVEELKKGTEEEIQDALAAVEESCGPSFARLHNLSKVICNLTAKQRV